MELEKARELVTEWVGEHPKRESATKLYKSLAHELGALLPDDGMFAVRAGDDVPELIGVSEGGMFIVAIDVLEGELGEALPRIVVQRLPLSDGATIELDQRLVWGRSGRPLRERTWRIDPGADEAISLQSKHQLRDPGSDLDGPPAIEMVARMACAEAGWKVPGQVDD